MLNSISPVSQKGTTFGGSKQPKSTQRVTRGNDNPKVLEKGLQALDKQRRHQIPVTTIEPTSEDSTSARTYSGYDVKAWVKAGLVVGTTALAYGVVKALGYFPNGWNFGNRPWDYAPQTDKAVTCDHPQKTDVATAVQQDQKTLDRHVEHYDEINRDLSLRERSHLIFEEREILDVDVPKKDGSKNAGQAEKQVKEIDTSKLKRMTHPWLLQAGTAPTVRNPISDQVINSGEEIVLNVGNHPNFANSSGDVFDARDQLLSVSATLEGGGPLPHWLTLIPPVFPELSTLTSLSIDSGLNAMTIKNDRAYVAGDTGVYIVDIANPGSPSIVDVIETPGTAYDIAVEGRRCYVGDSSGFHIIVLSNHPPTIESFNTNTELTHIAITSYFPNDAACGPLLDRISGTVVALRRDYLHAIHFSEYCHIGGNFFSDSNLSLNSHDHLTGVAGNENTAYVTYRIDSVMPGSPRPPSNSGYLLSVNISASPLTVIEIYYLGERTAGGVTVKNHTAYVAGSLFSIVDVSNPETPFIVSSVPVSLSDNNYKIMVNDEHTVFMVGSSGLSIIDVRDETSPVEVGFWPLSSGVDVDVVDNTAFVLESSELHVINMDWIGWRLNGTPLAEDRGDYRIRLSATNQDSQTVSDTFSLTVANYRPTVANPLEDQDAFIGSLFTYVIPENTFGDGDGDTLTFTAALRDGSPLPKWLSFDEETHIFTGVPDGDTGVLFIKVTADDGYGGQVTDEFILSISPPTDNIPPVITTSIPDQVVNFGIPFSFTISSGTFTDADGDPLTYTSHLLNRNPLPNWLQFDGNTQTFSGVPPAIAQLLTIVVNANDNQGGTVFGTFELSLQDPNNHSPVVVNRISNQEAKVGKEFVLSIPETIIQDPDGDPLTYTIVSELPSWLNFNSQTRTFKGTPGRSDTDTYADRDHFIEISAGDGQSEASTNFTLSVTGVSSLELGINIGSPLLSGLITAYGLYKKRGVILNPFKGKSDPETTTINQPFNRIFRVPSDKIDSVIATINANPGIFTSLYTLFCCGKIRPRTLPGNLPRGLHYDFGANALVGKPETTGVFTIQAIGDAGVIEEQFDLTIRSIPVQGGSRVKDGVYDEGERNQPERIEMVKSFHSIGIVPQELS